MTARVEPPWSDDQVASLNAYQASDFVHPFTGQQGATLRATAAGWVEHDGGPVVQKWAHQFMADWSWRAWRHLPAIQSSTRPERMAAVSLVFGIDNILCVWNRRYKGWSLPGGMVEDGETPEDAQRRELEEETWLLTKKATLIHEGPHGLPHKPGRASVVRIYLVEAVGEPREMEDGCPVQWLSVEEFLAQSPFRDFYSKVLPTIASAHWEAPR